MSGFDFEALRDPQAPLPGSRERAGVDARARQLRARSRLNRLGVAATSLAAVVAIAFGVAAVTRNSGPAISVPGGSTTLPSAPTTVGPSIDDRFIPPTTTENGLVVLPVTLPDGETFAMRYPPEMRIAQLGFAGSINVSGSGVTFAYTNIQRAYGDTKPISVYRGAHGETVPLYAIPPSGSAGLPEPTQELAFQFGPWLARIPASEPVDSRDSTQVPWSEQQLSSWARSLTGTVDSNGYLVLDATAPLSISHSFYGGFGQTFDGPADPHTDKLLLDSHNVCGHPLSPINTPYLFGKLDGGNVQWCVEKVLHVEADGTSSFLTHALHDLQVSPLTSPTVIPTEASTTTTTTIPRPGAPAFPISASFVSPNDGWVVEENGLVAGTTDGGATWHVVGEVGGPSADRRIRFATATRGFVFNDNPQFAAPILTTDDGGASWTQLNAPFTSPYDLAISNGIVYAVSIQPSDHSFRIWSAPADTLSWTEDPLAIPIGAGPIPQIQLVFSGGRGWLVEVDRVVIAGAQMSTTGHWSTWTPPCRNVNGPAELAASTGNDLVAACDEGVWGPPQRATTLYFSHDGGATFQRHVAKQYGQITSPNPQTALVIDGNTLQRTTDEGATWHFAEGVGDNVVSTPDLGFTTPTQGFAILGDGRLLMTHDAGATWKPATLP